MTLKTIKNFSETQDAADFSLAIQARVAGAASLGFTNEAPASKIRHSLEA